jgi:hypothetical protein
MIIPSIIDSYPNGSESHIIKDITISKTVNIEHVQTPYGLGLKFTTNGSLKMAIHADYWAGDLSLSKGIDPDTRQIPVYFFINSTKNFTIQLDFLFYKLQGSGLSQKPCSGGYGGCSHEWTINTTVSSQSNWILINSKRGGLCFDGVVSMPIGRFNIAMVLWITDLLILCVFLNEYKKKKGRSLDSPNSPLTRI